MRVYSLNTEVTSESKSGPVVVIYPRIPHFFVRVRSS